MLVLGIESTCDEMAASIVKDGTQILSNSIATQTEIHKPYGGVFPELASRSHSDSVIPIIDDAIKNANIKQADIDLIAVANGPGLMGSLLIGLSAAKALAYAWEIPFIGVDHVEAHMYAPMMGQEPTFPALGIVISGGHTFLAKITSIGTYEILSSTVDDAIGEAFDKVARMLNLPYPGGPEIEKIAKHGNPNRYPFKAGYVKRNPLSFSFSGLKTNVLYTLQKNPCKPEDIAASFQKTALMDIVTKSLKMCHLYNLQSVYIGGGVSNNQKLREYFSDFPLPIYWPSYGLSLDNAAMIAGLGYHLYRNKQHSDPLDLVPFPRLIQKKNTLNSCLPPL